MEEVRPKNGLKSIGPKKITSETQILQIFKKKKPKKQQQNLKTVIQEGQVWSKGLSDLFYEIACGIP